MDEEEKSFVSGDGSGIDGPLGHPNLAFCSCGSAWFNATVCMEQDGTITGYMELSCADCNETKPIGFTGDHPWQFTTEDWREQHGR